MNKEKLQQELKEIEDRARAIREELAKPDEIELGPWLPLENEVFWYCGSYGIESYPGPSVGMAPVYKAFPTKEEAEWNHKAELTWRKIKRASDLLNPKDFDPIETGGHRISKTYNLGAKITDSYYFTSNNTTIVPYAGEIVFKKKEDAERVLKWLGDDLKYLFHHCPEKLR